MFALESSSSSGSSSDESDSESKEKKNPAKVVSKANPFLDSFRKLCNEESSSKPSKERAGSLTKGEISNLFMIDATRENRNMAIKLSHNKKLQGEGELSSRLNPGEAVLKADTIFESSVRKENSKVTNARLEELMKKSVITPEFLKKEAVPPYVESLRAQKKRKKADREKTKGKGWFDMPATELTEERKRDLEIMQLRSALDTKQVYRHDDRKVLPKYFQIGTVVEDPSDFYSARIPKKQRKQTIVDELLADANFRRQNKRKYSEVIAEKRTFKRRRTFKPKKET